MLTFFLETISFSSSAKAFSVSAAFPSWPTFRSWSQLIPLWPCPSRNRPRSALLAPDISASSLPCLPSATCHWNTKEEKLYSEKESM